MAATSLGPARAPAWLVLLLLSALTGGPSGAVAQEQDHAAGLVIDHGDGRVSYAWVPFGEESISGIELLKRSGLSLVSVTFGGLGEGVCSIEGTGCGVEPCRARLCQTADRASPYWQYVRQDGPGNWRPFALGASQSEVRDGDIDGWAWTGAAPELPALTLPDIAGRVDSAGVASNTPPRALAVTEGGAAESSDDVGWGELVPAAAIITGVIGVGSIAIWRGRRTSPRPS